MGRGVEFWQSIAVTEMDELVPLAKKAEEVGFTGVALADHLVKPQTIESRYPYAPDGVPFWEADEPFPDPWVVIAALAAETTRLRFIPYVYVVPMRDPFSIAKSVSTAALLSGDRVVLGVGAGWMREEFVLTGHPFEARGRRMDEMLEIIALLMKGGPVEYHGRFYDFDPVEMAPSPKREVEIRVGGYTPVSLRRAARHDGWLGLVHTPAELDAIVSTLRAERERLGRAETPFDLTIAHDATPDDPDSFRRYRDAGATSFHMPPWRFRGLADAPLAEKERSLETFAERYIVPMQGS